MGRPARPFILVEIYLSGKAGFLQSGKGMLTFHNAALIFCQCLGRLLFARCAAQHFRLRSMLMAIPNHSSSRQTWLYKTQCWNCGNIIFVLQCTCGSAVLFNNNSSPFDHHTCSGGIGDSGYSGWEAIDVLRNEGMPVSPEIMRSVFGRKPKGGVPKVLNGDIRKCPVECGKNIQLILNLSEFHLETDNTIQASDLTEIARELEGLPKDQSKFRQMTFISNNDEIRESYTALIIDKAVRQNIKSLVKQKAVFFVQLKGLKRW